MIGLVLMLRPATPPPPASQPYGVTDQQRDDAYSSWLSSKSLLDLIVSVFLRDVFATAGLQSGLSGMLQYQVSHCSLTKVLTC